MDFTKYDNLIAQYLPSIEAYQDSAISSGKYSKQFPVDSITKEALLSSEINEYVAPNGKGWSLTFKTTDGVDTYIRSIGYGVEAEARTFNWQKYPHCPIK